MNNNIPTKEEVESTLPACDDCGKVMLDPGTESCSKNILIIGSKEGWVLERFYRNTTYFDYNERCHDCGILNKPGNTHHYGCDIERCPKCGLQLLCCECVVGKSIKITDKDDILCQNAEIKPAADLPGGSFIEEGVR